MLNSESYLLKRLGAKDIQLMPDAGAIANPHIARAHQETLNLCRKWGYRVNVGDWGQFSTKEHLHVDELLAAGRQSILDFRFWIAPMDESRGLQMRGF